MLSLRTTRSAALAAGLLVCMASAAAAQMDGTTRYVRFRHGGDTAYGIVEGSAVHVLDGDLIRHRRTGRTLPLSDVELLAPVEPGKVIAVGLNYRSHIGDASPAAYPGLFLKLPTSISAPGAPIVRPPDSHNLHYEGEMVVVIGKRASHIAPDEASGYIFGVTAGNDVSERDWQRDDLQWMRAKASDGFGPVGPAVVAGLDYSDLALETRVNGEVRQAARTTQLIFDVPTIVSYISRYVTLEPGDIIFTGTPGQTRAMEPGEVVEVELEGVGILRNPVTAAARH